MKEQPFEYITPEKQPKNDENDTVPASKFNKIFVKGIKASLVYPSSNGVELYKMFSVGFDGRFTIKRVMVGIGAGFKLPRLSEQKEDYDYLGLYSHHVEYGGLYMDLSGNFYIVKNKNINLFCGIGITPCFNVLGTTGMCLAPNAQAGIMFYKLKHTVLAGSFRFGKNVLNVDDYSVNPVLPMEFGVEFGLLW